MEFTHFNENGRAWMVDVTDKNITYREAEASAYVEMKKETLNMIKSGGIKKGDVFSVAQVAGIMGAKKTPELIPMCHPLLLTGINIEFNIADDENRIYIKSSVKLSGKTGVEMEALTAVSVAALTIYDMCKAVDKEMLIGDIKLLRKSGGKSGEFIRKNR